MAGGDLNFLLECYNVHIKRLKRQEKSKNETNRAQALEGVPTLDSLFTDRPGIHFCLWFVGRFCLFSWHLLFLFHLATVKQLKSWNAFWCGDDKLP